MKTLLAVLATVALLNPPLVAAPHWTALGPFGGYAQALILDPTDPKALYATTGLQGTFRTLDGGLTWVPIYPGLNFGNVAVDPSRPSTIYLSVASSDRILKSLDRGAHWMPANGGLPAGDGAGAITVDPGQPSRVYAAVEGVWHSRDRGASWQPARQPLPEGSASIIKVLVASARPVGTVFAGTPVGLYRSADGGDSWQLAGLPVAEVMAVAVAPSDPRTVWVSLRDAGLYVSLDGGVSWRPSAAQPEETLSLAVSPRSARTVFAGTTAGLVRSTDGGAHWGAASLPDKVIFHVAAGGRFLYVALLPDFEPPASSPSPDPGGVLVSSNEGKTWQVRNQGLADLDSIDLAVNPANPHNLWAAMGDLGLSQGFRGAGGAVPWERPEQPPSTQVPVYAPSVAFSADGAAVYAVADSQLWLNDNRGGPWSQLLQTPSGLALVRADPRDAATVYAADRTKLYASHDNGAHWQPLNVEFTCFIFDVAVAPSEPATLYAAGANDPAPNTEGSCVRRAKAALYRSADGGASWTRIDAGLPGVPVTVAVAPSDPRKVYVPLGTGVWRSQDGGATWAFSNVAAPGVASVAVSSAFGTVWAGTFDSRVFASLDGGATWQPRGGPQAYTIRRLIPDPLNPLRLYAATWSGVWVLE